MHFLLPLHHPVYAVFAAVLGAIVGSFLNVCIYRMPRELKVSEPRRSFCPQCQRTIPWYQNIPLVSWLLLRGKCAACGKVIPFRYFFVEALTATLFLLLWMEWRLPLSPIYALFAALLIVATFIDLEHLIIPDEITLGGTAAGLIASALFPGLHGSTSHLHSFLLSAAGAAFGYFLVWGIVEAGKLAFGKKKVALDPPEAFSISVKGDTAILKLGEDELPWEDIFNRPSDELVIETTSSNSPTQKETFDKIIIRYDQYRIGDGPFQPIEQANGLEGIAKSVIIPREAMGFGDVKFMASIGAFLGWQGVIFTLFASSVVGSLIGISVLLATRGKESARIPYGPFLALGAILWLFGGQEYTQWYFRFVLAK